MTTEAPYDFKSSSINPDAFQQTTYWYDKKGNRYLVDEMDERHLVNTMKYMLKHHTMHKPFGTPLFTRMANRVEEIRRGA